MKSVGILGLQWAFVLRGTLDRQSMGGSGRTNGGSSSSCICGLLLK